MLPYPVDLVEAERESEVGNSFRESVECISRNGTFQLESVPLAFVKSTLLFFSCPASYRSTHE
jgi:hypothetical protein